MNRGDNVNGHNTRYSLILNILLGATGGCTGAVFVYPIDLVKTRMQNQRKIKFCKAKRVAYKNSIDCFRKAIKFEGFFGLYRGLTAKLVGIAPEKAVKLTVNDCVRGKLSDVSGNISLPCEIFAGSCSGFTQVLVTNPLEIIKIRLQVAGEIPGKNIPNFRTLLNQLGIYGLYRGVIACWLREIPFSAIYFTTYAHTKLSLADTSGYNSAFSLLIAGLAAGIPASFIVTPADVIKTRLQVIPSYGQTTYTGIIDTIFKISVEEGFTAFWRGAGVRMFLISPQYAVTVVTYELLQRLFGIIPEIEKNPV